MMKVIGYFEIELARVKKEPAETRICSLNFRSRLPIRGRGRYASMNEDRKDRAFQTRAARLEQHERFGVHC